LVNCAGKSQPIAHNDLDSLTDEIFDTVIIDNLRSTFATMRAFLPLLKSSPDAVIVNIGSTAAQGTGGSNLAYAAAKAGIECLTRKLAPVIAPVRILTVCPGALETSWLPRPPDFAHQVAKGTPLGRIGTVEDVASAVYACITGMKFSTGQSFLMDGGRTV
jgi:3-oxoacyl-[acyl-carrier protein] reductase